MFFKIGRLVIEILGSVEWVSEQRMQSKAFAAAQEGYQQRRRNLTNLQIEYPDINPPLPDSLFKYTYDCKITLCQNFSNWKFFICKGNTNSIYYYNNLDKTYTREEVFGFPYEVRDFILYDINHDSIPEIIILSTSTFEREILI